jgi:RNA polymerase sigma-70 factor (ECF subfamily)
MNDLVSRLKKKDVRAFEEVMQMFKGDVFRYLLYLTASRETAEELTQDTFVKLYFKAATIKGDNLKGWIFKVALNNARSHYRKERLKNLFRHDSLDDLADHLGSAGEEAADFLFLERIRKSVPEKYLTPLLLKELQNFSYEEIARILKKPVGTVKSLVSRAKLHLREDPALSQEVSR